MYRCTGCLREARCKTMTTTYEGKEFKLTLCQYCWQVWYEHIMINGNRYRKVDNVSFIKKHQNAVVRDTLKNIMALQESRRLLEIQKELDKEAIKKAEQLYDETKSLR